MQSDICPPLQYSVYDKDRVNNLALKAINSKLKNCNQKIGMTSE